MAKKYVKRFLDNFTDIKEKTILDCGTGSGYMAVELAKVGACVIACDLNLKNLVGLKKLIKENGLQERIMLVCCSAEYLPFKDGVFDYFISNAVLEHLPDEKEAIREIDRVTKNGAGLMITVPVMYRYLNPLFLPINIIYDRRIGHLRRYNKEILENKFFNWNLLRVYYTGHTAKFLKTLINICVKIFDERDIETEDETKSGKKIFSSNIISFFKKHEVVVRDTGI